MKGEIQILSRFKRLFYESYIVETRPEVLFAPIVPPEAFGILTTASLRPFVRNSRHIVTIPLKRVFTSGAKKFITSRWNWIAR